MNKKKLILGKAHILARLEKENFTPCYLSILAREKSFFNYSRKKCESLELECTPIKDIAGMRLFYAYDTSSGSLINSTALMPTIWRLSIQGNKLEEGINKAYDLTKDPTKLVEANVEMRDIIDSQKLHLQYEFIRIRDYALKCNAEPSLFLKAFNYANFLNMKDNISPYTASKKVAEKFNVDAEKLLECLIVNQTN